MCCFLPARCFSCFKRGGRGVWVVYTICPAADYRTQTFFVFHAEIRMPKSAFEYSVFKCFGVFVTIGTQDLPEKCVIGFDIGVWG